METNNLIYVAPNPPEGLRRGDGHARNNPFRLFCSYSVGCSQHACSRRQTIVHQDHGALTNSQPGSSLTIQPLTTLNLQPLSRCYVVNHRGRQSQLRDQTVVQHPNAATCDGANRQLFAARQSELSNEKNVQLRAQRSGNFKADGNSTPWKSKDKCGGIDPNGLKATPQGFAGFGAVAKEGFDNHFTLCLTMDTAEVLGHPLGEHFYRQKSASTSTITPWIGYARLFELRVLVLLYPWFGQLFPLHGSGSPRCGSVRLRGPVAKALCGMQPVCLRVEAPL
jgi:hypothetical protein